jgi:hypothetical protein
LDGWMDGCDGTERMYGCVDAWMCGYVDVRLCGWYAERIWGMKRVFIPFDLRSMRQVQRVLMNHLSQSSFSPEYDSEN